MALAELASQFSAWSQSVVESFGYLGIFLISFIGNASIILPMPTFLVIFAAGAVLNPWLVGIAAGFGAALGEIVGYLIGRGGREVIERKQKKWLDRARGWAEKYTLFAVIAVFAATPLPDDVVGIFAGVINYNMKKFFVATLIGKIVMSLALSLGGFYSIGWVLQVFGGAV
jgi:membrane protein YqaA with SNARE-associated domain